MVGLGASAQLTDGTVYWLQDASTGEFLSAGANWGTRAVVKDVGGLGFEATYVSDGVYKLKNIMLNKVHNITDKANGLGDNLFVDNGSPADWTLTASGEGYTVKNGDNYLCNNGNANAVKVKVLGTTTDASQATIWKFLTRAEYDNAIQAYKDGIAANIASSAGLSATTVAALLAIIDDENQYITKDYTSCITNATLADNWNNWTHGGTPDSNRGEGANVGSGCAEFWNGCGYAKQTITGLPQGIYRVDFAGTYRPGNSSPAENVPSEETSSPAFGYANNDKVELVHWIDVSVKANNRAGIASNKEAYNNTIYTYVGTDGTLELGIVQDYWNKDNNYQWCPFGQFKLTYYTDQVAAEDVAALIASIPTRVSDKQTALLAAAKTTLEANSTIANYNALNEAIQNAQTSANEYAIIDAGTVPTDGTVGWAISTTKGELACNGWSEEGKTDGSEMTTPFVQDWASAGNALADGNAGGKLYYSFTDLNPNETYVVTARVRVFNEAGTGVTGATYFVGNSTKSLETFGAACTGDFATKGKFAVLSCAGTVDSEGKLQFGVELASDSPINWISIKDVTIAAGTGDVPTSIELNKSTVELTTGGFEALTATITPATADDKTILWSSSDENVATVAGGHVVALKAGTAVITAQAYAGDNIKATATVTVTDAAAPTFYSTTIAAEDYYIVNAATGLFLGGGNSWGTQASLIEHGIPFTATVGEGVYTLDSHTYNDANSHFLNGTYVDGASTNLYITSLGEGKFSISTAETANYLTALAGSTVASNSAANTDSPLAQWYFLSKKDRDKMLAAASATTPADATYYVKQANPSRNLSAGALNENAWSQYNVGGTQDNSNYAAQVYNAVVDNYQTIENIPNGTYTVTVQAFTSGTDVKFYANDQKVDVKNNDSGATLCSAAAALFAQGLYPNTVTVTVTDRTLKIGFEGDCTGKWLCYDNVELYMTSYTANTGLTANIDNSEIEAGSTATITAATDPATASFNAITFTSDNEEVATVDENGVVTGLSVGTANITVAATEMEEFSETIPVTVKATAPTALALSSATIELDATTTTAELTVNPTPANANTSVTWASSDETVATVIDGVVTAVSTGTATITATSTVAPEVSAEATVTVTFSESTVPAEIVMNDGPTRTIYTLGENLIKNGSFEYPNPVYGWTTGTGSVNAMSTDNFNIPTEGAADGNQYLQAKESKGGADAKSINTSWPLEDGKTYVFGYKIKANKQCTTDLGYIGTSLSNTKGSENSNKKFETPAYGTEWQDVTYTFTNTDNYKWLVFNARWMANAQSFDNVYLAEAAYRLEGNVDYATAAIPTANIGTGAFQYSQAAVDAANALVQGEATVADVEAAYEALTTLNVPKASQAYNLVFNCEGHSATGNALTLIPNPSQTQGLYGLKYLAPANKNLAQAFYFTHTTGNKYKVYAIDTDGNERYITTQAEGYGTTWYEGIRTIDDATKAMEIEIRPNGEGLYLLWNIGANKPLAHNGNNNNDLFTNNTANFQFVETQKPSITINTTDAKWGTTILPFAVASLPTDVKAYTCAEVNDALLTLGEVTALEANKPYIIEGSWEETLTGDAQGTALTYTEGLLTGVYEATPAPAGSYVLQKNKDKVGKDKVGFYKVDEGEGKQPTVGANRCYLTVPSSARAFFLFDNETGISAIEALTSGEAQIFDINGVQQPGLQKGMNIIRKADGQSYKVMVK